MGKRPLKDIDSAARSRFLRVAFSVSAPICLLSILVGPLVFGSLRKALFVGGTASILLSVITYFIIEHIGSFGGNLLSGKRKPIYSDFEKYEGPLNQARHLKSNNDYKRAHEIVKEILKKTPDLPEALYLNAQILWEGFQDAESSINCLRIILVTLPDENETYHRWSISLIKDIRSGKS